jgi:hypothetical protein
MTAAPAAPPHVVAAPGTYLCGLTWDGRLLWHSDQVAARVYAIDPGDGVVVRSFPSGWVRADLAYDGRLLAQVGGRPKRLALIDPADGAPAGTLPILPANDRTTGIEIAPDGLWALLRGPNVVQLRTYPELEVVREHRVPGDAPSGLTVVGPYVVFGDFAAATLHVVDRATGEHVRSAAVQGKPTGMTWDGERLWYCDFPARALRALAPAAFLP